MMKLKNRCCRLVVLFLVTIIISIHISILSLWMSMFNIDEHRYQFLGLGATTNESHQTTTPEYSIFKDELEDTVPLKLSYPNISNYTKVIAKTRAKQGFLTIGIPSIKRINGIKYVVQTIDFLINMTSADEKNDIVVVVFLCDPNVTYNDEVATKLSDIFSEFIESGFIHIGQVLQEFYPDLTNLKRNFGDDPNRVKWRSKQVLDYAFMFFYSERLNKFYLQIEDDVKCAKDFVRSIKSFIITESKRTKNTWAVLEFSELGFIGKLFKAADLHKLVTFMVNFFDEQPVDWLITNFRLSMGQRNVILRKPTLFQHMGLISSFDTVHENKLKDKYFQDDLKPSVSSNKTNVINQS